MYSCYFSLISSTISVLYCAYLCMKCSLGISNFLEEISSLSHSVVFLYFLALIAEAFLSLLAILWNSAFICLYLSFSPLLFTPLSYCTAKATLLHLVGAITLSEAPGLPRRCRDKEFACSAGDLGLIPG